eukprot:TRINITY_DN29542_c0_g1_i1.p1 TRINITY_DN29542_c0_g1~~TRINITY_DN29542_c0_g1_i1.p1  ORF type:complete len:375 (-),score=45.46 TRINITY_DN29542_c0_g1_i1:1003-2127(-)
MAAALIPSFSGAVIPTTLTPRGISEQGATCSLRMHAARDRGWNVGSTSSSRCREWKIDVASVSNRGDYNHYSATEFRQTIFSSRISCRAGQTCEIPLREEDLMAALNERGDRLSRKLNDRSIFLIGMMGCGKTTVGRIVAEALGYGFFDSDSLVEQTYGATVATIFKEKGEQSFRELESQAISQLASMDGGLVVATGGGAIIRKSNWKLMRSGIVVWIDVPLEALAKRVVDAGVGSRPILSSGMADEDMFAQALNKLQRIYNERKHMYPMANVRISLQEIAAQLSSESSSTISATRIALTALEKVDLFLVEEKRLAAVKSLRRRLHSWTDDNELGSSGMVPYGYDVRQEPRTRRNGTLPSRAGSGAAFIGGRRH